MAQRLVRVLCDECKKEDKIAEDFATDYKISAKAKIYKATGCSKCGHTGYIGRKSIGELLIMNDNVKDILKSTTDEHTIKTQLQKDGLITISMQLLDMLKQGKTSLDEAIRIGIGHA